MNKIIIFLIFMISLSSNLYSNLTIKGKIQTQRSESPETAHVTYKDDDGKTYIIKADDGGNFEIELNNSIFAELTFSAANHQSISQKFPIPTQDLVLEIKSKLLPNIIKQDLVGIKILSDFNDFDFESDDFMKPNDDGTYSFEIEHHSDTLKYQILPVYQKSLSGRTFNGSQSDFYIYDNGGDYYSVLVDKSRKFHINFNPLHYPTGDYESDLEIDDEDYHIDFVSYQKVLQEFDNYLSERSLALLNEGLTHESKTEEMAEIKRKYLLSAEEFIEDINDKNIRNLAILEYIHIAHDGVNIRGVGDIINKQLLNEVLEIDVNSSIWKIPVTYYNFVFAEILSGNIENPEYVYKVLESNQSDEVKSGALGILTMYCHYNELTELKKHYYKILQEDYKHTKEAKRIKFEIGDDRNIMTGKSVPYFELKNLDDTTQTVTPESLKGKFVLVDIWGTWCMPCLQEIPYLVEAYEKFKDKGFTIYSVAIDASAQVVKKFKDKADKFPWLSKEEQISTNLPWLHSYGGNWDSDIINTFEVFGVPTTFLIDPNGKILSTDYLRGDELIETLNKHIKQ
ncbi:MAG: redoxin domain-containing protein [Candidatus Kapaibacterium sp.]